MSETGLNEKIESFLESALEKFLVNDYNEAIRDLKAAEVLDKDNPQILYNLGINYSRLGLHKTACIYFEKIINLPFGFVDILSVKKLLSFSLIHMNDYSQAEKYLNEVLDSVKGDITALSMKAYCYERTKNYFEALKLYQNILEIDKNNYNAYNSCAYIMASTGKNLKEAYKLSYEAYNYDKKNPAYMDTLGYICLKMGDLTEAERLFSEAEKLLPFNEEIKSHQNELRRMKQ
jgi:tetratricopeptide (TPR) repeat protein